MKKTTIYILICAWILTFSACKAKKPSPEASTGSTTESIDTIIEETDPVNQLPMYAISAPTVTETATVSDGKEIFKHIYQNISLVLPEQEIADKVILDFLNKTDLHAEAETRKNNALTAFDTDPEVFSTHWMKNVYSPTRIDASVLSMYGCLATYSGGAHGEFSFLSANYDLVTGNALTLQNILTETATADTVCDLILHSLDAQKQEEQLFDGYETIVKDLIQRNFHQVDDWFFSDTGLCFFFSPYEIGPFSSADVIATIPYDSLIGILNDSYFPVERDSCNGIICGELFNSSLPNQFTQLAEIVTQNDATTVLLYTDKCVYDVALKIGSATPDGIFTPEYKIFAAHTLTPGDALVLEHPFGETASKVQLSYTTSKGTSQCYVQLDTSKNKVILTEN